MRDVLVTDYGGALYRQRKAMVEPVFAQTKHNRRIDRFQRRGKSAARSEWRLITATHNHKAPQAPNSRRGALRRLRAGINPTTSTNALLDHRDTAAQLAPLRDTHDE
jgi:hypothetical protein